MKIEEFCVLIGVPLMIRIIYPRSSHDGPILGTHACFLDDEHCEIFVEGRRVHPLGNGFAEQDSIADLVANINALKHPIIKCRSIYDNRVIEISLPKFTT